MCFVMKTHESKKYGEERNHFSLCRLDYVYGFCCEKEKINHWLF